MLGNKKISKDSMKTPGVGVDFHMHTVASDGVWTPETLVKAAVEEGLHTFAVSDHDSLKSVRPTQKLAAQHGLNVIPGVEITVNWRNQIYHMLVLNYNVDDPALNTLLEDTQRQERARKEEIIAGFKKRGYKLDKLDDLKRPDGHYLATDIIRALQKGGEIATFEQGYREAVAFGLERICAQPADKAIEVALGAGGLPMLAHPGRAEYGFSAATPEVLHELRDFGLAGLEVYHYSHSEATVELYKKFALENDMLISAGSDSHGTARMPTPWNPELVRALLERLNWQRPTEEVA